MGSCWDTGRWYEGLSRAGGVLRTEMGRLTGQKGRPTEPLDRDTPAKGNHTRSRPAIPGAAVSGLKVAAAAASACRREPERRSPRLFTAWAASRFGSGALPVQAPPPFHAGCPMAAAGASMAAAGASMAAAGAEFRKMGAPPCVAGAEFRPAGAEFPAAGSALRRSGAECRRSGVSPISSSDAPERARARPFPPSDTPRRVGAPPFHAGQEMGRGHRRDQHHPPQHHHLPPRRTLPTLAPSPHLPTHQRPRPRAELDGSVSVVLAVSSGVLRLVEAPHIFSIAAEDFAMHDSP